MVCLPDAQKTEELCKLAMGAEGMNMEHIPDALRTPGVMLALLESDPGNKAIGAEVWEHPDILLSMAMACHNTDSDIPVKKAVKNPAYWMGIGLKYGSAKVPASIPAGPYELAE